MVTIIEHHCVIFFSYYGTYYCTINIIFVLGYLSKNTSPIQMLLYVRAIEHFFSRKSRNILLHTLNSSWSLQRTCIVNQIDPYVAWKQMHIDLTRVKGKIYNSNWILIYFKIFLLYLWSMQLIKVTTWLVHMTLISHF